MDEHDLRNCMFVSFTVNVPIMSALSIQESNDQLNFYSKNKNAGKIRAWTSKLESGVAALYKIQFRL